MLRPTSPVKAINEKWVNWSRSLPEGPHVKYRPGNIEDLVEIAKNANSTNRIKASGSRWSSSAAAKAEDAWVDTSELNQVLSWDLRNLADELWQGAVVNNLVLVQAGIKVYALATALWEKGFSVPTLGGSMGQSIAGVISTGTHGTDIDRPPIAAMVRAIHLVAPDGKEFWLEHPNRPIASRASLEDHYDDWYESMEVKREADLFNAALVSVGRCGFIYSYILEVEPAYKLLSQSGRASWQAAKKHLADAALSGNWYQFIRSKPLPFNESTSVRSGGAPAPISVNGQLSLLWVGTNSPGQFRWTHQEGKDLSWTRKRIVDDGDMINSKFPPAIAFFKDRYYMAWTDTNSNPSYINLICSTDNRGSYWDTHIIFNGGHPVNPKAESSQGPILLAANGKLHLVWLGSNNPGQFRWITSTDGISWGDKRILTDAAKDRESNFRPAFNFFNNRYYLAWTGTNPAHPHLHLIRSTDATGRQWEDHIKFDGSHPHHPKTESSEGPILFVANKKLHLVWVGSNKPGKFRWITSVDGMIWGDKRILTDPQKDRESNYAPGIVFHDGKYYLFWAGYGADQNIHLIRSTSASGNSWADHTILKVPPGPRIDYENMRSLDIAISPFSANENVWWTIRTTVSSSLPSTPIRQSFLDKLSEPKNLDLLTEALAKALDPKYASPGGGLAAFLTGLAIGGPLGGIIFGIAGAIAGGVAADSSDVFVAITDMIFKSRLGGADTYGPSYQITSGNAEGFKGGYEESYHDFWHYSPKAQYTEIFFNGEEKHYLDFVDALRAYFRSSQDKNAGYIAIRFMKPSQAPLGMQRWPVTVAIEVALLVDLNPKALQTIEYINSLAEKYEVRFHWGMTRPLKYQTPSLLNEIEEWKKGAAKLNVQAGDGFSSDFSQAAGLEPEPLPEAAQKQDSLLFWGAV